MKLDPRGTPLGEGGGRGLGSTSLGASLSLATMGPLVHAVGPAVRLAHRLPGPCGGEAGPRRRLARSSGSELVVWRPRTLWVRSLAGSCSLACNFYALTRLPIADAITLFSVQPPGSSYPADLAPPGSPGRGEASAWRADWPGVGLIERPHLGGGSPGCGGGVAQLGDVGGGDAGACTGSIRG